MFVPRRRDYDLTSADDTARLFDDAKPELVFHLAAEVGGIGANRANPGRYWYANLMMGAHILEQARIHETPKLVIAGTICAYPKFAPVPFREEDLWNGYPEETNAPYGVAKKAVLVGAQSYRAQYGLDIVFLLPVNLYGPGDNFDLETSHVIPALIRKMVDAQTRGESEIVLWGDGSPTREFLYVDDCAEGLALAAERYDGEDPVNLGTGEEISIRELAELIGELDRLRGIDHVGHVEAERAATPQARHDARDRALRVHGSRADCARGSSARSRGIARPSDDAPRSPPGYAEASGCSDASPSVATANVGRSLAIIVALQLALALWLFASVAHNGWLTYQGGDQMWLVTSGWLLAHGTLATPVVSYGWPVVVAPLTWITGSTTIDLLPYTTILQVAILGPLGTLAIYDIGARIAGRAAGLWCALVLVLAPYLATPLFVDRYRERWTDQILVQATGFTQLADYPSTIVVLVCTALVIRALAAGATREAVLAGTLAGLRDRAEAVERALPRRAAPRVRARTAVARGPVVRPRVAAGARDADAVEVPRARHPAVHRAGLDPPGARRPWRPARRKLLAERPVQAERVEAQHGQPSRVLLQRPAGAVGAVGGRDRRLAPLAARGSADSQRDARLSPDEGLDVRRRDRERLVLAARDAGAAALHAPRRGRAAARSDRVGQARVVARASPHRLASVTEPGDRDRGRTRRCSARVRACRLPLEGHRHVDGRERDPRTGRRLGGESHRDERRSRRPPHVDRQHAPRHDLLPRLPHGWAGTATPSARPHRPSGASSA